MHPRNLTVDALDREVEAGRVTRRVSEDGHFAIYNYAPEVAFSKEWNEVNMQARGLVINLATKEIVARPFPKFFNLGEIPGDLEKISKLGTPEISEKLDGSLGIVFWDDYAGRLRVTTRGSLDSDQGKWATEKLNSDAFAALNALCLEAGSAGLTTLVEIIYPENRIVIPYGSERMPLLGMVSIADGKVMSPGSVRTTALEYGVEFAKDYSDEGLDKILKMREEIPYSEEGWVLSWEDPESPHGRYMVKVKGEEYLKLHRLIFGMNHNTMLDMLEQGQDPLVEWGKDIPDEFYDELEALRDSIKLRYDGLKRAFSRGVKHLPEFETRKDAALWAQGNLPKDQLSLFFAHLDGKVDALERGIWKRVREDVKELHKSGV